MSLQTIAICLILGLAFNRLVAIVNLLIEESQVMNKMSIVIGAILIAGINFGIGFIILKLYEFFFGV